MDDNENDYRDNDEEDDDNENDYRDVDDEEEEGHEESNSKDDNNNNNIHIIINNNNNSSNFLPVVEVSTFSAKAATKLRTSVLSLLSFCNP